MYSQNVHVDVDRGISSQPSKLALASLNFNIFKIKLFLSLRKF